MSTIEPIRTASEAEVADLRETQTKIRIYRNSLEALADSIKRQIDNLDEWDHDIEAEITVLTGDEGQTFVEFVNGFLERFSGGVPR